MWLFPAVLIDYWKVIWSNQDTVTVATILKNLNFGLLLSNVMPNWTCIFLYKDFCISTFCSVLFKSVNHHLAWKGKQRPLVIHNTTKKKLKIFLNIGVVNSKQLY